jgi:hypothetical protein
MPRACRLLLDDSTQSLCCQTNHDHHILDDAFSWSWILDRFPLYAELALPCTSFMSSQ